MNKHLIQTAKAQIALCADAIIAEREKGDRASTAVCNEWAQAAMKFAARMVAA